MSRKEKAGEREVNAYNMTRASVDAVEQSTFHLCDWESPEPAPVTIAVLPARDKAILVLAAAHSQECD